MCQSAQQRATAAQQLCLAFLMRLVTVQMRMYFPVGTPESAASPEIAAPSVANRDQQAT